MADLQTVVDQWQQDARDVLLRQIIRTWPVQTGLSRSRWRRRGRFEIHNQVYYSPFVNARTATVSHAIDAVEGRVIAELVRRLQNDWTEIAQSGPVEPLVEEIARNAFDPPTSRRAARRQATLRRRLLAAGTVLPPPQVR